MLKKVYALETYALIAVENYVIMATVAHNRTDQDVFEVLRGLYKDLIVDEEGSFIVDL